MTEIMDTKCDEGVVAYLNSLDQQTKIKDSKLLIHLMEKATNSKPKMWGNTIIGFGERRIKFDRDQELDWFIMGFSPRNADLSIYLSSILDQNNTLIKKLGNHKLGKGCLFIKQLDDVDINVLEELIIQSV